MGRCWTWYASMGGSTRPIALSRGEGVWCLSSQAMPTYHWWAVLCVQKMPTGKYVGRPPRGCGMCDIRAQFRQRLDQSWESGIRLAEGLNRGLQVIDLAKRFVDLAVPQ